MTGLFSIYRPQGILTLLQTGLIIGGCLLTRGTLKLFGYGTQAARFHDFPVFVRNWGLLLILIPAAWCLATVWSEERSHWFSQRMTLITGIVLLAFIGLAMAISVLQAAYPPW
ncbi:MAG: hypothetical protein JWM59_2572 [Verrucomicrobiales bacterium]|nr:hypothetical protein [Verrucomicrobiales bacterium]